MSIEWIEPHYDSFCGKGIALCNSTKWLCNNAGSTLCKKVMACALKILVAFPFLTLCATLDLTFWIGKTITIIPAIKTCVSRDFKDYLSDLTASLATPFLSITHAFWNKIPKGLRCINKEFKFTTLPLHDAIIKKNYELMQDLIILGAEPAITNKNGENAFHIAADKGDTKALHSIGSYKDPGLFISIPKLNYTPLESCLHYIFNYEDLTPDELDKYCNAAKQLIFFGSDCNKPYLNGETIFSTALFYWAQAKNYRKRVLEKLVEEMLIYDANPNVKVGSNDNALDFVFHQAEYGKLIGEKIVQFILENGVEISQDDYRISHLVLSYPNVVPAYFEAVEKQLECPKYEHQKVMSHAIVAHDESLVDFFKQKQIEFDFNEVRTFHKILWKYRSLPRDWEEIAYELSNLDYFYLSDALQFQKRKWVETASKEEYEKWLFQLRGLIQRFE